MTQYDKFVNKITAEKFADAVVSNDNGCFGENNPMNEIIKKLTIYTPEQLADILVYGSGICIFCANESDCKKGLTDIGCDMYGCYEGIIKGLEGEDSDARTE